MNTAKSFSRLGLRRFQGFRAFRVERNSRPSTPIAPCPGKHHVAAQLAAESPARSQDSDKTEQTEASVPAKIQNKRHPLYIYIYIYI